MADSSEIIEFYKQAGNTKAVDSQQDTVLGEKTGIEPLIESDVLPVDPFAKFLFTLNKNLKDKQQQITAIKEEAQKTVDVVENDNVETVDPFGSFIDKLQSAIQDKKGQAIKETTIKFINQLKDDKPEEEIQEPAAEEVPVESVLPIEEATPLTEPIIPVEPVKKEVTSQKEQPYIKELKAASQTQKVPRKATKPNDIKTLINQQVEAQTSKILEEVKAYAKRILDLGGGGGSVAQQFANGGTMTGTLNVTGQYLSGGRDLTSIFSGGGGSSSDRLISGNSSLILNSDGTLQFPNNTIRSQDDTEIILESENASLSAFTQVALTPHGFFAYDNTGDSIAFDSVSNTIVFKTVDNYTWTLDDQGNIIGPSGTLVVSGNVNTTGNILSGGRDLASIFLTHETDSQTLTYTPSTYQLSISNGNTVSLASLSSVPPDLSFLAVSGNWNNTYSTVQVNSATNWNYQGTDLKSLSSNWQITTATVSAASGNWNSAYNTATAYQSISSNFVTSTLLQDTSALLTPLTLASTLTGQLTPNAIFNTFQTNVQASTATLLPTSIYQNASSSFATNAFVTANFFNLTGGNVTGDSRFNGNVTVFGNLTATGTTTFANTVFSTTSALSVVHIGGSGPALYVGNNGTGDIASFYDIDQNVEVLHIGGVNSSFPNVGIRTSSPNKTFTVVGEISATSDVTTSGVIYANNGNSNLWNTAYNITTTYQNISSTFATNSILQSTSALLTPLTLTNTLTSQLITNNIFDSYRTSVASTTATLLPTSVYQSASGNWQNTFTTVSQNSALWGTGGGSGFSQPIGASVSYVGDGVTTAYTISSLTSASNNANAFLVTLNGVVQQPTVDYTVSGTTLTFTSIPYLNDKILILTNTVTFGSPVLTASNIDTGTLNASSLINAGSYNSNQWSSAYVTSTAYQATSGTFATRSFTDSKYLPLSGGTVTNNLTISGSLIGIKSPQEFFNTDTTTSVSAFKFATNVTLGYAGSDASSNTFNIATNTQSYGTYKTVNIGTNSTSNSFTNINIGSTTGSSFVYINGDLKGNNTSQNVFNTTATTLNVGGEATAINLGASSGTTTVNNMLKVNYTGNSDSSLQIAGSNTKGGAGYHDFLKVTNGAVGASGPNVFFRTNSVGSLEVLNSPYTASTLTVSQSGIVGVNRNTTGTNNIPTNNAIAFNGHSYIHDDGNMHITAADGNIWINANGSGNIVLNGQNSTGGVEAYGTFKMNSGYGSVAPVYGVRAWINFSISGGSITTNGSGNLSVSRSGAGTYVFTFGTAMPDANYSVTATAQTPNSNSDIACNIANGTSLSTTGFTLQTARYGDGNKDASLVCVTVVR